MVSNIESFQYFKYGITRIFHQDGEQVAGEGFLVSDKYVITCAHVVREVLGEERVNELSKELENKQEISSNQDYSIKLDFSLIHSIEKTIEAEVVFYLYKPEEEDIKDIAVLKLKGELPKEAQPIQLNSETNLWDRNCRIFGCPIRHERGVWIKGRFLADVSSKSIQIQATQNAGFAVAKGFSGAPVWVEELGGVVGMVVEAETDKEKRTAYMIPTKIIEEFVPPQYKIPSRKPDLPDNNNEYEAILQDIAEGFEWENAVVPFLGSGVNLCYRPETFDPRHPGQFSPTEIELALHLAEKSGRSLEELMGVPCAVCPYIPDEIPQPSQCPLYQRLIQNGGDISKCPLLEEQKLAVAKINLRSLSQYFMNKFGPMRLYNNLRGLFQGDCRPNELHYFFTKFPPDLLPLIVTTNLDDMLEHSFGTTKFDVIYYVAEGNKQNIGKFKHRFPDGTEKIISDATTYDEVPINERPVILKLYGTWNKQFAITEDHYVNYMAGNSINQLLPAKLLNILKEASILFLGYSLSDFDLDVILRRFWGNEPLRNRGWIVHQSQPGELEQKFWQERKVKSLKIPLDRFINKLQERL